MDEHSLLLIIDNDRRYLGSFLRRARLPGWGAEAAEEHTMNAVTIGTKGVLLTGRLARDIAHAALARIDWDFVADHYETKVREGVTVPKDTDNWCTEGHGSWQGDGDCPRCVEEAKGL